MRCRMGLKLLVATLFLTILRTAAADSPAEATAAPERLPEIPAPAYVTLALIRDTSIHQELKLTPGQVKAVTASIALVDEPFWQLRDVPLQKAAPRIEELFATLQEQLRKDLDPPQRDRLAELILQARGWKALRSPDMAQTLKLSAEQVAKFDVAIPEMVRERQAAEKEMSGQSAAQQGRAREQRNKSESRQVTAILTSRQQAEYTRLLGKPFDFSKIIQVGCLAPELRGVSAWINSSPLTMQELRGRVVVVHFWAFGCINCIRNLPHYQGWYDSFKNSKVTIIGIQTPETDSERKLDNLQRNVKERQIEYPVVFDEASENWKAWGNNMWPSVYLIDKRGRVRYWWYGELNWEGARGEEFLRKKIEELIAEAP